MRKTKGEVIDHEWAVNGLIIPVRIYTEPWRFDYRVSIASKSVIMRFPESEWSKAPKTCFDWGISWIKLQMIKSPHLFSRFKRKNYYSGKVISTYFGAYSLSLHESETDKPFSFIEKNAIILNLPASMDSASSHKSIPLLISRTLVARHKQDFIDKVKEINGETFRFNFNKITLRYTHNRWGSCSSRRNLNFSTRLFLAPDAVIRYVIIHELAHLKYYDHSKGFWSLIRRVMPDYQRWNKWLRLYGPMLHY